MNGNLKAILATLIVFLHSIGNAQEWVVYEGEAGFGKGKHIVFIASDHEYRGEETCPAIARILAKNYGFKCTVLFGQTEDGIIKPGSSIIPGIENIADADMLFLFLRFLHPSDEWMAQFEAYFDRGGPVLGLRTTTHAFNGIKGKYAHYNYNSKEWVGGFGRQILGETWNPRLGAGHYGRNHKYSTRLDAVPAQTQHPVLTGVKDMHAKAGAYSAVPVPGSVILATNQVLQSMEEDAPALAGKEPMPAVWVRTYQSKSGRVGRVFCSTQGASEDIVNDGYRRCIINGTLWCMGLENEITPDLNIDFVGPFNPSSFSFKPSVKAAKPADIIGWDTPILRPMK